MIIVDGESLRDIHSYTESYLCKVEIEECSYGQEIDGGGTEMRIGTLLHIFHR